MVDVAISVPGKFYTDAITKALEKTGNFRISSLEDSARDGPYQSKPDIVLLGVSVYQGYTLKERQKTIQELHQSTPNCKIVLFLDEVVSPEQTIGVKSLKQARLIDGFLYASGTMDYLVATLESI